MPVVIRIKSSGVWLTVPKDRISVKSRHWNGSEELIWRAPRALLTKRTTLWRDMLIAPRPESALAPSIESVNPPAGGLGTAIWFFGVQGQGGLNNGGDRGFLNVFDGNHAAVTVIEGVEAIRHGMEGWLFPTVDYIDGNRYYYNGWVYNTSANLRSLDGPETTITYGSYGNLPHPGPPGMPVMVQYSYHGNPGSWYNDVDVVLRVPPPTSGGPFTHILVDAYDTSLNFVSQHYGSLESGQWIVRFNIPNHSVQRFFFAGAYAAGFNLYSDPSPPLYQDFPPPPD